MNTILEQITEWLKGMLIDGIMNNLSGMFDAVNQQVGDVAAQVPGSKTGNAGDAESQTERGAVLRR